MSSEIKHLLIKHRDRTWNGYISASTTTQNKFLQLTSDTNNNQRLRSKNRKNYTAQNTGKQDFIDAIAHIGLGEHVQRKRQSGQDIRAVHVHRRRDDTIIPGIGPIGDIEWRSTPNVGYQAATKVYLPPFLAAGVVGRGVRGVRVRSGRAIRVTAARG